MLTFVKNVLDICLDHPQVPMKICLLHLRNMNLVSSEKSNDSSDMSWGVRMKNLLNLLTSKGLLKTPTSSIKGSRVKKLSKVF